MTTVALITAEESHRLIYETGLKKRQVSVTSLRSTEGAPRDVDAVVYDLPKYPSPDEFRRIEELGLPTVVLCPIKGLPMPKASKQRTLAYPVKTEQIIQALEELGVEGTKNL